MKQKFILTAFLSVLTFGLTWGQITVSGNVHSADGTPLIGVNIIEEATSVGTVTDLEGHFQINVDQGAILTFSLVGYQTKRVQVEGAEPLDVILEEGELLDEVVVTALGISREKKALGYAITEVSGEELTQAKESNVIDQLTGRVAGLVMSKSTAGPGSGTRIVIRGNNSLSGNNQPLYVVDGVPVDNSGFGSANGSTTANYRRSDYGTGISDLNSDDIASISVLKGPNAAALYGSRAANGVILITTKKGRAQKGIGVGYSAHYSFDDPMLLPKLQNKYGMGANGAVSTDYATLKDQSGSWGPEMDGSSQPYWIEEGATKAYSAQPDNVQRFFRTGHNFVQTVALEGGNERASMRFSYSNSAITSILQNSGLNRHNFNLRANASISDRLSLDAKVTYFQQFAQNRPDQGTEGIMAYVYKTPRNIPIEDLENNYQDPATFASVSFNSLGSNPYWILFNDRNDDRRNRVQGFAKATFKLSQHWSIFGRIGTDHVNQGIESVNQFGHWFYSTGRFNFRDYKNSETNADVLLMYQGQLAEDIGLNFNAGANKLLSTFSSQGVRGSDFKIPTKPTVSSAKNTFPFYNAEGKKKIHSVYGSASFSYKNFAYLDLTGRNDWSSTLPKDSWSYFYPSASMSLIVSQLMRVDMLDFAKIRMSWANVGSDTGPYQLVNAYNLDADSYQDLTVLSQSSIQRNPNLQPEQTSSIEFGLEYKMFNNRLYGDISVYSKKTKNLITTVPVSPATGYTAKFTNVGQVNNDGFEFLVGGTPVQLHNLRWDVSLNFSKNKNRLVELFEGIDNYVFSTNNSGSVVVQATVEGAQLMDSTTVQNAGFGDIYGTTFQRNENGDIIVDKNGRPLATKEKVYLGNYQPKWIGGLNNVIAYKGVVLRVLIDGRIGGQLYSGTDAGLDASGVSERTLQYREEGIVVDGVVNEGTADNPVWTKNTAKITGQEYWGAVSGIASNYVYDQTNVRLREIGLNFNLPMSMLGSAPVQSVSLGFVGRNVLFLRNDLGNFDPESTYSTSNFAQGMLYYNLPSTRSFGFNVKVNF